MTQLISTASFLGVTSCFLPNSQSNLKTANEESLPILNPNCNFFDLPLSLKKNI
jgi:hypothetical protein